MSDEDDDILDLRKVEDVFTCLEAVAMAQAVLMGVDPDTASGLEKVTEALGALTLLIEQGEMVQQVEKIVEVPAPDPAQSIPAPREEKRGIDDLVDFVNEGKPQSTVATPRPADEEDDDDAIIDILTGERII